MLQFKQLYLMRLAAMCALVLLTHCKGCGKKTSEPLMSWVPPEAQAVIHVPNLQTALNNLDVYLGKLTPGGKESPVDRARQSWKETYGLDPLAVADWKESGLDLDVGMVMFSAEDEQTQALHPVVMLGATDVKTFDATMLRLIEKLDGASKVQRSKIAKCDVVSVGRPFGDEVVPVLLWAHRQGRVIMSRAEGQSVFEAQLERLAEAEDQSTAKKSMKNHPGYAKLSASASASLVRVFAQGNVGDDPSTQGHAMTHMSWGADGFRSETEALLPKPVEGVLGKDPAWSNARFIGDAPVVVALSNALGPEGVRVLRQFAHMDAVLNRAGFEMERATGINPEKDALPHFAGPIAAAVYLNDLSSLPERLKSRSVRRMSDLLHGSVVIELSDSKAMQAALKKSFAALRAQGAPLRERSLKVGAYQAMIIEPDREEPRLGWGVIDKWYVYGFGAGQLEKALAHVAKSPDLPTLKAPLLQSLSQNPGTSVVTVRAHEIGQALSSVQLGPAGLGIGGIVETLTYMLQQIGDVVFAIESKGASVRLTIQQDFSKAS